jgi:4'-phosphopantetheinyl transferase
MLCPSVDCVIYWLIESAQDLAEPPEWFLSQPERERYASFRFDKRRQEWLLGRWTAKRLVQAVLLAQTGQLIPPETIEIANDPDGVPHIRCSVQPVLWHLSLSHAHGYALATLGQASVGADLEWTEPRADSFINDYFTPAEIGAVQAAWSQLRDLQVTALWSAKEAVLKVLGKGLSVDTRAVEIDLAPFGQPPEQWMAFHIRTSLEPGELFGWWRQFDGFVLTVASKGTTPPEEQPRVLEEYLVTHSPTAGTVGSEHTRHRIAQGTRHHLRRAP